MAGQQKKWLYFILDKDGRSYRKEQGLIVAKSSRKPLKYTPSGWQSLAIAWSRDLERWGANRNFSLPFGFVLDGAEIIRHLFYRQNFEQKVYLLIQKQFLSLTPTNYYFYYDLFYRGELDLTTVDDEEDKVQVKINEGGISQDLKANQGTEYEFPVDEISIKMDGINLFESAEMHTVTGVKIAKSVYTDTFMIPMFLFGQEQAQPGMAFYSEQLQATGNSVDFVNNRANKGFGEADIGNTSDIDLHLTGTLKIKCTKNNLPFGLALRFMTSTLTFATQNIYQVAFYTPVVGVTTDVNFDLHIILKPGENIFLRATVIGGITGAIDLEFEFMPDSVINISYEYRKEVTYIKAIYLSTLMKRLVAKMTGSEANAAVSALLEQFKHIVVTSGDAIRGLTGAVIKTKFDDFYKSVNAVLNAGVGVINKKIVLESKSFFLQESDIIPLGEGKEIKNQMATELIVNKVKIGYENQTYDDVNGKQEFNNTSVYSSPVKKIVKELDLTSVYRADCYGIEFLRINLAGKKTTDTGSDNDVFFINIGAQIGYLTSDSSPLFELRRETYDIITGLLTPTTVFNIADLTPARMLARHKSYLNSVFYGFEGQMLKFETTDKNRLLYTKKGTEIFDEDADYVIDGTSRLFKPVTFDFKPQTPESITETLEANPNRCFSFEHYNGVTYTGFNLTCGISANDLTEQAFLLLSTASNNLTLLSE